MDPSAHMPAKACPRQRQAMQAANMVPGHPRNQSSHRSKLAGILAVVKLLQLIHKERDLTNGSFTYGLDNKEARLAIMSQDDPKVSKADYDLILDIRKRKAMLPITFQSKWIEGYQDDTNKDYLTMDIWTLLNIEMDTCAGKYYQQHKDKEYLNVAMANTTLTVWMDKEKLASFDKPMLYNQVFARTGRTDKDKSSWTSKDFWKEREKIPKAAMEHIHWELSLIHI